MRIAPRFLAFFLFAAACAGTADQRADKPLFSEGQSGSSELKYMNGIPVLTLAGTPSEMGKAYGALAAEPARMLWKKFIQPVAVISGGTEKLIDGAGKMEQHIPDRFRKELRAMADVSGIDYKNLLASNAFPDIYRKGGCSTFAAAGEATKDGKPFLARNLDFFGMGVLQKATLVIVYRPKGRKAFVSVSWPGLSGVLSGMNRDGLCCAVMEVREGKVTTDGMPAIFLFRLVMEECATVKEALALLKDAKKTAGNNLILLDRDGNAAVAEIGPGLFKVRRSKNDILFSTNDHRAGKEPPPRCRRYRKFEEFAKERGESIGVEDLKKILINVDQGVLTVQSMIFEPESLRIHLATGKVPASKAEYKALGGGTQYVLLLNQTKDPLLSD